MANKNAEPAESSIHLSLQGKGGVGKSLIASILIQYFGAKGCDVHAVDTDPVNHTLAQYKQLNVESLELLRDGGVDQRKFDGLMERLLTESGTFDAVVAQLDYLIDLGITAIELMPLAQFPGRRNWGYDGVYPFAVQNSYGGPQGLKIRTKARGALGGHRRPGAC